ncbi:MAG: porin [Roseinatronobacter sp.]
MALLPPSFRLALPLVALLVAPPVFAQDLGPRLSGDARMGLAYDRPPAWAGQRETGLRMTARARLKFQFTGETDGGTRFGAEFRLDDSQPRRPTAPRVFIGE